MLQGVGAGIAHLQFHWRRRLISRPYTLGKLEETPLLKGFNREVLSQASSARFSR
jgi:hypothetical protein